MNVSGFAQSLGKVQSVPIVDAAVLYECPYTDISYCLIMHNALYLHEMQHNLVPPFLMRRAGVTVNEEARFLM